MFAHTAVLPTEAMTSVVSPRVDLPLLVTDLAIILYVSPLVETVHFSFFHSVNFR